MFFSKARMSFSARIVQPWVTRNYEKTKYGKELKKYKNKFKGERCFLVGNGPSLKADDLTTLHRNNEKSFAFNRIYNIFDQTEWRPTFYISQDEKMLDGCKEIIDKLDLPKKFIPIQLRWYYDISIHDATYFNMAFQSGCENRYSDNISERIYCSNTVMYTAVQMAVYMGFKEIYLIGVDHHFHISQNNNGDVIIDENVQDYFSKKYNEDKDNLYIPNLEKSTLTYVSIKDNCDNRDVKVFNATRGGKLEVFDRVNFDSLFKAELKYEE